MPARRIEDYGFLSDMESAALVSKEGSVDWLCFPRFDSAACFCALLHDESAGYWAIQPTDPIDSVERRYSPDSLVLETRFDCSEGSVLLTDCLAIERDISTDGTALDLPRHVFVRLVHGLGGDVRLRMVYRPRFDYGTILPWFRNRADAVEAVGGPDALDLASSIELIAGQEGVTVGFSVSEGESVPFLLSYHRSHMNVAPARPEQAGPLIERTQRYWRSWAERCSYGGRWREEVMRSLLTLKALTYAPSGGIVAAPTTSLPEQIGGPRNWDYRYCWLRDATFTLDALLDHGYSDAAKEWRDWLLRAVAGDPDDMQIMYGVLGERRLLEYELPLRGYEASAPVRVGNAAHLQFQLDVYGELMDSFHSARRSGIETPDHAWALEKVIVDHVCKRWSRPDDGIWEVRSGPQNFVHSKVMAWVAVDRGVKAIELYGKSGPLESWSKTRDAIKADVLQHGVEPRLNRFKRSYVDTELDASLLLLPVVGFVSVDDPLMLNTIDSIERDLMVDGLMYRYRTDRIDDGLPPGESTFLMCSFWWVDCLVLLGRYSEAEALFERLVAKANDLCLLSEQYDPHAGRLVGNFPQAFSHVALVTSATALHSAGRSRAMRRGQG